MSLDEDRWRKSSRSAQTSDCVELHPDGAARDSKNSDGPVLRFSGYAPLRELVASLIRC